MDGLLLDSERIALNTFLETCRALGLEDETKLFKQRIGASSSNSQKILKEALTGKVEYAKFRCLWSEKYNQAVDRKGIPVKKGALEALRYVRSMGLPIAVATQSKITEAEENLKRSGLIEYFSIVVGGDCVRNGKPSPEIYLKVASNLGVDPITCLAIEDSDIGVRSAHNAGMTVVQIPDIVMPSEQIKELGHIVLDSLADVCALKL